MITDGCGMQLAQASRTNPIIHSAFYAPALPV